MITLTRVIPNCYRDSLSLMQLSARAAETSGVDAAAVVMATDGNRALLRDAGLFAGEADAGANDMLVVVRGDDSEIIEQVFAAVEDELSRDTPGSAAVASANAALPRSLAMSLQETSRQSGAHLGAG